MDGVVHEVTESDMTEKLSLHFTVSYLWLYDMQAPDAEQFMTLTACV